MVTDGGASCPWVAAEQNLPGVEGLVRRMGRRPKVPGRGWIAGNLDGLAARVDTLDALDRDDLWCRFAP